jgi:hypothetical protein
VLQLHLLLLLLLPLNLLQLRSLHLQPALTKIMVQSVAAHPRDTPTVLALATPYSPTTLGIDAAQPPVTVLSLATKWTAQTLAKHPPVTQVQEIESTTKAFDGLPA